MNMKIHETQNMNMINNQNEFSKMIMNLNPNVDDFVFQFVCSNVSDSTIKKNNLWLLSYRNKYIDIVTW